MSEPPMCCSLLPAMKKKSPCFSVRSAAIDSDEQFPGLLLHRASKILAEREAVAVASAGHYLSSGEDRMPSYLMLVNLTDQGVRGVKEIPNRQDRTREVAKKLGIERKQVWMTFGPYDFVHLYEAPNEDAMAKFALTLGSFGNIRTTVMRAFDEAEHLPLIRDLP